jgi:hypothetical protein
MTDSEHPSPAPEGPERGDHESHGSTEKESGERRLAVRQLAEAVLTEAVSPYNLHGRAVELHQARDLQGAERYSRQAIAVADRQGGHPPEFVCDTYLVLAAILQGQSKHEEALPWLHKASEMADSIPLRTPPAAAAAIMLERAYHALGRQGEAAEWKKRSDVLIQSAYRRPLGLGEP